MKKLILTLSLMTVAVTAFGQGRVNFANNNTDRRIVVDTDLDGVAETNSEPYFAAGPNSQVAIYALGGSNQPASALLFQATAVTNLLSPGFFLGGVRTLGIPGGPATLQVRAWSGAFPNFEAAEIAAMGGNTSILLGRSAVMNNVILTEGITPPPTLLANGLNQFVVAPVPEPSSIALGLLGLGAIVLFRRRK